MAWLVTQTLSDPNVLCDVSKLLTYSLQFDWYFSAEHLNSPNGVHLKKIIGDSYDQKTGRFTISLSKITRWRSIEFLFPSTRVENSEGPKVSNNDGRAEIMEALQTSETVNVIDNKRIERKFDAARHQLQTKPIDSDDGSGNGAWDLSDNSPLYVAPTILRPVRPMVRNKHQSLLCHG